MGKKLCYMCHRLHRMCFVDASTTCNCVKCVYNACRKTAITLREIISFRVCGIWLGVGIGANVIII